MRLRHFTLAALGAAALLVFGSGCATRDEWATWKTHPTHFASGAHMGFSVRNRTTGTPRVTREDITLARDESWWGRPVTVSQEQILER
ncbi:MAG: hypothetical protein AUH30_17570 [Candidatus Rokubacteria bacterium 13_1_40CM_68_15]|nr:MAG: hypothetical protein AUH30_17570 [Candidatus Rokubacteria bacterium 13_1_40CM_68_15]